MGEQSKHKELITIPFAAHEADMDRMKSINHKLFLLCVLLILALIGTNIAWVIYESQFESVVVTQENADGYNNYIGNDGDIYYGQTND